jgi:hypothetical protein
LPDDVRVELEDILAEVTVWVNEHAAEINLEYRELIRESGRSEIIELDEDAGLADGGQISTIVGSLVEEGEADRVSRTPKKGDINPLNGSH